MVDVQWKGNLVFEAQTPTGNSLVLDAYPEEGEKSAGPTPMEALLASLAACAAIDVISIMEKKRQRVTSYRVEIDGDRPPQGEYPRPFRNITIKHIVAGENVDPVALARAIELSEEKYCSVAATLRVKPNIHTEWVIEEPALK